jgi:hypothetical protein
VSFTPVPLYPCTHWIGGWMGPRVGLDHVEKRKILHCWEPNPGRRARISSLYRLSHPDCPPIQRKPPSCRISGYRSGDCKHLSSGTCRRVMRRKFTEVSEDCTAYIFRVGESHRCIVCYLLGLIVYPEMESVCSSETSA